MPLFTFIFFGYKEIAQKYAILAILVCVAYVAGYKLTESPPVWYDEGLYMQSAMNWSERGEQGIQLAPQVFASASNNTVGFPLMYPIKLSFDMFGVGVFQARAVMVLFIVGLVACSFFFLQELFGRNFALYGAALLATFPVVYGNGKSILGEVPGMMFVILFLFFLSKLEKNNFKGVELYVLAGLVGGLAIVTKPIYLLLLPALALPIFFLRKKISLEPRSLLLSVAAFFLPVVLWLFTQFDSSDSFVDIIRFYATPSGIENTVGLVLSNVERFFTELSPLYVLMLSIVWAASIFFRSSTITLVEWVSFTFLALIMAAYMRTLGWYRYFFPAQVVSLLFLPIALRSLPYLKRYTPLILAALIVFNAYQLLWNSFVAENYGSTKTAELQAYFGSYGADTSFFVYNAPEVVTFLPTRTYYQYLAPRPTQVLGEDQLHVIQSGIPDEIIIHTDAYRNKAGEFALYIVKDTLNRYTILAKKYD